MVLALAGDSTMTRGLPPPSFRGLAFAVPAGGASGTSASPTGFFFFGFEAILSRGPGTARERGPQNIGTLDSTSQGDRTHRARRLSSMSRPKRLGRVPSSSTTPAMLRVTLAFSILLASAEAPRAQVRAPDAEFALRIDSVEGPVRVTLRLERPPQKTLRLCMPAWSPGSYRLADHGAKVQ